MIKISKGDSNLGVGVNGIVSLKNKVLLIQREDLKIWALPGGVVEENETLEQAVAREVWEETGIKVMPKKLTGIYLRTKWKKNLLFAFLCKKIGGQIKTGEESLRVEWVPLTKARKLLDDNSQARLDDAVDLKNQISLRIQNKAGWKLILLWQKKNFQEFIKRIFS